MFWEADGVKLGRRSALRPHAESQQKLITAPTTEDERSRSLRHSMTRACNDPEFGWTNDAGKSHENPQSCFDRPTPARVCAGQPFT